MLLPNPQSMTIQAVFKDFVPGLVLLTGEEGDVLTSSIPGAPWFGAPHPYRW